MRQIGFRLAILSYTSGHGGQAQPFRAVLWGKANVGGSEEMH